MPHSSAVRRWDRAARAVGPEAALTADSRYRYRRRGSRTCYAVGRTRMDMEELAHMAGSKGVSADEARVLDHGWRWFSLHADQRMRAMNFFLVAAAFLTASYVRAIDSERHVIAAFVAVLGVVATGVFWTIESRTRQLVHVGEAAMQVVESRLAETTGIEAAQLTSIADERARSGQTYSTAFRVIYAAFAISAVAAAVFAVCDAAQ